MARIIWTEPAVADLDAIADYIALDKPDAAARHVQQVFAAVERLARFPKSGTRVPEIPHLPYRQVVVSPSRIFYRLEGEDILIVFVMRGEQRLREIDQRLKAAIKQMKAGNTVAMDEIFEEKK